MITISHINNWKKEKYKFAAITAYDAAFANLFSRQGIKVILVGDSLGMTIQGRRSTLNVSVKDMIYHTKCVRRGAPKCFIISDMPFMSYANLELAFKNSMLLIQSGANMVKIEGGNEWNLEITQSLTERFIPVCGHIGLTPQSINILGRYKVQGRDEYNAKKILLQAQKLEKSGIKLLILECIPEGLAKKITNLLKIPVIGIGAGIFTDGQIMVMHDILGITHPKNMPSFSKNFLNTKENNSIDKAILQYIKDVEMRKFPDKEHTFD